MPRTITALTPLSSTTLAAGTGSPLRIRWDLTGYDGAFVWLRITNGASAPTTGAIGRFLTAVKQATMPAAGSVGTGDNDWKLRAETSGGTAAYNASTGAGDTWLRLQVSPAEPYIEAEIIQPLGNSVTVEAGGNAFLWS